MVIDKVVIEISGGYDSALAALLAKDKYKEAQFYGLMVNYGQIPFRKEFSLANKFCKKENVSLKVVSIANLWTYGGTLKGEEDRSKDEVAQIYTPLRNLVIGACAASYAESVGAQVIVVGSKGLNQDGDPYSFKDSILPFYTLLNTVTQFAAYKPITIDPIFMWTNHKVSKKEVYQGLLNAGYGWDDFWNCFNSEDKDCMQCNNCQEKYRIKGEIDGSTKNRQA